MNRWEFWRFYKSGQFIFMEALEEDIGRNALVHGTLDMVGAIYTVTEYMVFAERMAGTRIFGGRCEVNLSFHSPGPRVLHAGRNRIPFFEERRFDGGEISITRNITHRGVTDAGKSDAANILLEFFDFFGWEPAESQIAAEQEKFFSLNFN